MRFVKTVGFLRGLPLEAKGAWLNPTASWGQNTHRTT